MLWLEFSNATTIALYSCISINKILIWWKQDRYYQNLLCLTVLSCSFSPGVACPNGFYSIALWIFTLLLFLCFPLIPSFFYLFHSFLLSVIRWLLIAVATAAPLSVLQDAHLETKMIKSFFTLGTIWDLFQLKSFPSLLLPARGEDYKHLRVQSCKRQELRSCHCWGWPLYTLDLPADHTAENDHGIQIPEFMGEMGEALWI